MISEESFAPRRGSPTVMGVNLIRSYRCCLLIGAAIYWIATTTDTNKIFGPSVAGHSSKAAARRSFWIRYATTGMKLPLAALVRPPALRRRG
jgi:hypothetical protein